MVYKVEFLHPPRYSWRSIYISVPDNEGVFTEKRSSINSFVTTTWTKTPKLIRAPRWNKSFSNSQWPGEHNGNQDFLIRALIHWLLGQSVTCIILLFDFCFFYIAVYYKSTVVYINSFLKWYCRSTNRNQGCSTNFLHDKFYICGYSRASQAALLLITKCVTYRGVPIWVF